MSLDVLEAGPIALRQRPCDVRKAVRGGVRAGARAGLDVRVAVGGDVRAGEGERP